MRVCFPAVTDEGANSSIYGHFASAPLFVIIDTTTGASASVANCDPANPYNGCNPFSALKGERLDGVVVGGIGDESLRVMNMCGFKVYQAASPVVAENLALLESKELVEMEVQHSHLEGRCSGGGGCSHKH